MDFLTERFEFAANVWLLFSAAGYLEVILEIGDNQLTQEAHELYKKLDQMLSQSKGEEIYTFISCLNAIGLQLNVTVKPVDPKE